MKGSAVAPIHHGGAGGAAGGNGLESTCTKEVVEGDGSTARRIHFLANQNITYYIVGIYV